MEIDSIVVYFGNMNIFEVDGIMYVMRGGNIKTYKKVNGDFIEIACPHNEETMLRIIAEEKKKRNKSDRGKINEIKQLGAKTGILVKPKLKRNEKHINGTVIDGGV
jgi:hypothetical protein